MAAASHLIFPVAALQVEPRFFIAFLVEIVQQGRVCVARHLFRQLVQSVEQGHQIWFWFSNGH